jgi:predicted MFS family arabinose efflux permease
MRRLRLSLLPEDVNPVQRRNFRNAMLEGVGTGIALSAGAFLAVFLTRMGASSFQVGLLSAMPGVTGFFLSVVVGRFLQTRRNIVPWFSWMRLLTVLAYTLTGLAPFFVPDRLVVPVVLGIWALATVPQTFIGIAFSVVMSGVAGPKRRYLLMSRRWSVLGMTKAVMVALAGQVLDRLAMPINYQVLFLTFSLGGLVSFFFARRLVLPDVEVAEEEARQPVWQQFGSALERARGQPAFLSFIGKRYLYSAAAMLAMPLFPLYFVREVQASDSWIGIINTAQTAVVLVGYFIWTRQSRRRGGRFVLLVTMGVMSFYPLSVALTRRVELIALFAALTGVFQPGLNLALFDELMKTVPPEEGPTFVSLAQSLQHFFTVVAPLLGTLLSQWLGLSGALMVSTALRLISFSLFLLDRRRAAATHEAPQGA